MKILAEKKLACVLLVKWKRPRSGAETFQGMSSIGLPSRQQRKKNNK